MYRSLEITEIIGSVYVVGHQIDSISITEIRSIMSKVSEKNQFISLNSSCRAMNRALSLANQDESPKIRTINIPQDDKIHLRFIREYYKLDLETRSIITSIIKEFIHDGKI